MDYRFHFSHLLDFWRYRIAFNRLLSAVGFFWMPYRLDYTGSATRPGLHRTNFPVQIPGTYTEWYSILSVFWNED